MVSHIIHTSGHPGMSTVIGQVNSSSNHNFHYSAWPSRLPNVIYASSNKLSMSTTARVYNAQFLGSSLLNSHVHLYCKRIPYRSIHPEQKLQTLYWGPCRRRPCGHVHVIKLITWSKFNRMIIIISHIQIISFVKINYI